MVQGLEPSLLWFSMHSAIAFKAFIQAEILPEHTVLVFDENQNRHLLQGRIYEILTPYLTQGVHSKDQIVENLQQQFYAEEIYYALLRLSEMGFIEEDSSEMKKSLQILCNLLNIPCKEALKKIKETTVSLHSFGHLKTTALRNSLKSLSIQVKKKGSLAIIISDNYRNPNLIKFCNQLTVPYFLVKPTQAEVWIGPLFSPQNKPCINCLLDALNKNFFEELIIDKQKKKDTSEIALIHSTMGAIAYHFTANEVFKWIVQGTNPDVEAKILSYHFLQAQFTSHQVIKKHSCAKCGITNPLVPKPLILEHQKKHFTDDGGHRIKPPDETFDQYKHLISPITGIMDYLVPSNQGLSSSMHTYEAGHLMTFFAPKNQKIKRPRIQSAGKGKTATQGKTSCLCEAIERYSGVYQGNEYVRIGSFSSVPDAIDPESILLFSPNQYQIRHERNLTCYPFHHIPDPFDRHKEIDWTPVWSLTQKKFKWIPTSLCYFSYPNLADHTFGTANSNGSAAGNTKEEAILQGFFELIERDSVSIWWYNRIQCPEVELDSFSDPHIERLKSDYRSMNRILWVLDITMDFQIPTFAAISCKNDNHQGEISMGFGAHFDPKIALMRALTEMNQPLLYLDNLSAQKNINIKECAIRSWLQKEILKDHLYLTPSQNMKRKRLYNYIRLDQEDLKEDILTCQRMVEEKGMEMLILDLTRADIGLPVVKVFVPGLRHFWNRFAPGRLYDVPVKLGLLERKLEESELNPIPFFF